MTFLRDTCRVNMIRLIIPVILYFRSSTAISPKTYGPFDIRWGTFDVCSGPKSHNVTIYNATTFDSSEGHKLEINMTVLTASQTESIKITVYSVADNHKTILWNYKVNKPCEHAVIAPVIGQYLPLSTCVIVKGNHHIVINFTEVASTFLGSKFHYGDYLFKIVMMAKKGNIVCLEFTAKFVRK